MQRPSQILAAIGSAGLPKGCAVLVAVVGLFVSAAVSRAKADENAAPPAAPSDADLEFFEKQVRPLLVARCHECHGAGKQKGNLRLDSRASILRGGDTGAALVAGDPEQSLLVDAIRYGETYQMPPKGRLPDAEVAILVDWVRRGAPWPAETPAAGAPSGARAAADFDEAARHWCFQPLAGIPPPPVARHEWPRNGIDQFILARLEAEGLAPAAEASRRTWLRRVTYDLIGLPPTSGEIDDFLADESTDAYERVVERLLASPHYGERQARRWLDLVRFAETYGHEHDYEIPNAYPYRDYLIRAFNADVPYNQLVIEHLAGDLVDPPRRHPRERGNESILGTGFYFLGEARHSPVDVREDEAAHVDNQIDVFSKTFLALTVGCARCHDHKFDAITQRDYYALAGYLQSSRYQQAFIDDPAQWEQPLAQLANLHAREREVLTQFLQEAGGLRAQAWAAWLFAPAAGGELRAQRLQAAARADDVWHAWQALVAAPTTGESDFAARRAAWLAQAARAPQPREDDPRLFADFAGPDFGDWSATGMAFGEKPAAVECVSSTAAGPGQPGALPLAIVGASAAHSGLLADKLPGTLRSPTFTIEHPKIFYRLWGTAGQVRLIVDGLQLIQDPIYGGLKFGPGNRVPHWHEQNVSKWVGHRAYIEILDDGDGWIALERVMFGAGAPPAPHVNQWVAQLLAESATVSSTALADGYQRLASEAIEWWLAGRPTIEHGNGQDGAQLAMDRIAILNAVLEPLPEEAGAGANKADSDVKSQAAQRLHEASAAQRAERDDIVAKLPAPRRALAVAEGTPENEHVFIRGNHKTLGPEVPRRLLQVLGGEQRPAPANRSGRLELAQGLVDGSQPLVPRVMVNRLWQWHFGRGIVPTPDDFGRMGQPPTHPELLDWLAAKFQRQGWSIKALDRLLVLSATYRMSAAPAPESVAADPNNRLWHHMPRRRLEAECIRDAILAVSGRFDPAQFGPGVPPHLTPFMSGRGRPKESGPLDGAGRRSIYLNVRRNFLSPMLLAFDYPIPFTTIGRRSVSNVPAQALVMMNNPFVAEQAALWARHVLARQGLDTAQRAATMYVAAFGRPPDADELAAVDEFLARQRALDPAADDQRLWSDLAHVLFNAKEFVFVE